MRMVEREGERMAAGTLLPPTMTACTVGVVVPARTTGRGGNLRRQRRR